MSGSVEKNLLAEIELLKLTINEKQMENEHILNRKDELEESLLAWQDKFQRLYESHKRITQINQNLEEKLLRLVDENTRQRAKLTNSCASLNIRLNKSNARIAYLQNEIERYKKDISLAINLLRLNPDSFISPNFNSLPIDTKSKLCQFIKKSSSSEIDEINYQTSFRGYESVPVNDPIYHHNDLLSPITVTNFLESELRKNVGIQTNSINFFTPDTLKEISQNENFVHHERCDRVKINAHLNESKNDCLESRKNSNITGVRSKESKKISIQQFKENDIKQFEHFISFFKNKSHKTPRICAMRINDDGIYLDLDSSQELFIKTSSSESDEIVEKTECASPTTLQDETYSINKTDSEKFNEIKSSSQADTSQGSNENAFLKHQRVAEWLKSNINASNQINDKPKEISKNSIDKTKESVDLDLLQMEYNVKQFMLKQQNEWKDNLQNIDCCKTNIDENNPFIKMHRTETNL